MRTLFNLPSAKNRRQLLRKQMPSAEKILWWNIRNRSIKNFKFKRQYSIDKYVVDFYCPATKLVIEIDGDSHYTHSAKVNDFVRQQFIESLGLNVLRFTNEEIYKNLNGVLEIILNELIKTSS